MSSEKCPICNGLDSKLPSIDNVTIQNLDISLRMVGIDLSIITIDKIIDLFELLMIKGDGTTVKDISKLSSEWEKENGY